MHGCFHTPPCGSASVHHARRGHEARIAREAAKLSAESAPIRPAVRPDWLADNRGVAPCKASPTVLRAAAGRVPWELSAAEFDAVCEPWFETTPGALASHRMFGLSVSTMRFGLRLRLVVLGGPEDGYVADVEWADEASMQDPRRAFIADALAHGERVPAHILSEYPDLLAQA